MAQFRIKALRKGREMTRNELAGLVGVTYMAVKQWEDGRVSPTADKLPTIAAALGCGVGDLYDDEAFRAANETAKSAVMQNAVADARALIEAKKEGTTCRG